MTRITIADNLYLVTDAGPQFTGGECFHEAFNADGGSVSIRIGRIFVTTPHIPVENFHNHTRIDVLIVDRLTSPEPAAFAHQLAKVLLDQDLVQEPVWLSWWQAKELGGDAFGEVFDLD